MADDSLKKLLVRLGISTTDWKKSVQQIKSELKELQAQSLKDFKARTDSQKTELDNTKKQVAEQKVLAAESQAMAAFDRSRAEWTRAQTEVIKQKLTQAVLETAELRKQAAEQNLLTRAEQEKIRLKQQQVKLEEQQTRELEKQRAQASRVPSAAGLQTLWVGVAGAVQSDVIQKIQTEALQKLITEERVRLSIQEAQLRVMSTQEGVRKVDVEVVQKEITAERSKIALLDSQLRARLAQERSLKAEQEMQARVPSAIGVSALRTGVTGAIPQVQMSREQIANAERLLVEERARVGVQEAQLRLMAQQEGVRRADVAVLQKEITEERARLSVQEAQLSLQRAQVGAGGEGGGGFVGGALMSLGGGMFGMGLTGMMVAGVAAGQLLERALEKVGEKVREVGQEMLKAAGPAGALREQFNKLATREGQNPEEFLNRLRVATRGLVDDNALLVKVANQFMAGPLKLQPAQIEHLTEMTVALARAQGKDATEAMNALSRAALTGRTQMLSWVLGITRGEMAVRGLGRGVSATAQQQLQLSMTMDAMTRKLAEVGTPMTTLADVFKQVGMVQNAFTEDMAYGLTHSEAFSQAIQKVSKWLQEATPHILDFALGIGQKLGVAFEFVEPLVTTLASTVKTALVDSFKVAGNAVSFLRDMIVSFVTASGYVQPAMMGASTGLEDFTKRLTSVSGILATLIEALTLGASGIQLISEEIMGDISLMFSFFSAVGSASKGLVTGGVSGMKDAWHKAMVEMKKDSDDLTAAEKKQNEDLMDSLAKMEAARTGQVDVGKAGPHLDKTGIDPQVEAMRRRLALQIAQEDAKTRLEIRKQEIADEEEAEKQKYEMGLESLTQYLAAEKGLRGQAHLARIEEIEDEKKAKLAELSEEARGTKDPTSGKFVAGMDPTVYAMKKEQIEKQANLQIEQEETRHQKEMAGLDKQGLEDQLAAERAYVNNVNKIQKQGVSERTKILEDEFKTGSVGADDYLAQRKALIEEEYVLTAQGADLEYQASKKNADSLAKLRVSYLDAEMQKERDLQNLEMQEADIRLQGAKARYDQAREVLQSGIDLSREAAGGLVTPEQTQMMVQLRDMTREYIDQLREVQSRTDPLSKDWADVSKEMSRAVGEERKLNVELAKAKDFAGPLGNLFGTIASELGDVLGTKTTSFFENMAKSLESISKVSTGLAAQMGGAGAMYRGLWTSFKGLFGGKTEKPKEAETAQQIFERGLTSAAGQADKFASTIDTAIESLVRFANSAADAAQKITQIGAGNLGPVYETKPPGGGPEETSVLSPNYNPLAQLTPPVVAQQPSQLPETVKAEAPSVNVTVAAPPVKVSVAAPQVHVEVHPAGGSSSSWEPDVHPAGGASTSWETDTAATMGHFQLGGVVPETGSAVVHAGEYVIPSDVFSSFIQALNSFGNKIGRMAGDTGRGHTSDIPAGSVRSLFSFGKKDEKTDPLQAVAGKVTDLVKVLTDAVNQLVKFTSQLGQTSAAMRQPVTAASKIPDESVTVTATAPQVPTITSDLPNKIPDDSKPAGVDPEGGGGMFGGLRAAAGGLAGIFQSLSDKGSEFHDKMDAFTKNLGGAIGQIGGVVKGVTSGKTAGQGALSGGMSGLSFGAQFGPWGALIGAGVGATMGALIGHKQEMMQKSVDKLKAELQSIIQQLSDGTITMSSAIASLRAERQQAVDLLKSGGGGKKGNKAGMSQVVDAISQELQKVIDLQKQTLDNMAQQIDLLAQTPAYQPLLQQLDEIINKYKEFASAAAGNTQEVAAANEYLTESLQNYATTLGDQLHQANIQAVQDAISLIDLQKQKNDLDAQAAQQEYDILTQGVTARQMTTAMTKGEQIAQIKYEHDMKSQDLNEEIAVTQHKVDAEQQIFDLATTRIGLETQLLELQNESTDKQMSQVTALQETIQAITSAIASGNLPSAIEPGGVLSTGSQLLTQIMQLLGLSAPPGGAGPAQGPTVDQYIAQYFPSEFYSLLEDAVANYPDYLKTIVPALETAPGSPERQTAEDWYRSNLESAEKASNLPVSDWINFIRTGTFTGTPPEPPSGYQMGGVVPQTGTAIVHAGEYVIPSDVFADFIQALNGFAKKIASFLTGGGPVDGPILPSMGASGIGGASSASDMLRAHLQIFDLSTQRVAIETGLLQMQQDTISMDMQRIQALRDLATSSSSSGGGLVSLEGAFSKIYENRGRMGLGGFTRQQL